MDVENGEMVLAFYGRQYGNVTKQDKVQVDEVLLFYAVNVICNKVSVYFNGIMTMIQYKHYPFLTRMFVDVCHFSLSVQYPLTASSLWMYIYDNCHREAGVQRTTTVLFNLNCYLISLTHRDHCLSVCPSAILKVIGLFKQAMQVLFGTHF